MRIMSDAVVVTRSRRTTWVGHVTLPRVIVAELIKLTTLPSFVVSFVLAVVLLAGLGVMTAVARIVQQDGEQTVSAEPGAVLAGVQGTQLIIVFVAAVFATTEFANQTVQPSYLAVPRRVPVLLGKAVTVGSISLVFGAAGAATALAGASLLLGSAGLPFDVSNAYSAQLIVGTALYLLAISLIGLALGALIRSTVGAILTGLAVLNILPLMLGAAPFAWLRDAAAYLPSTAGLMILQQQVPEGAIQPWPGLAVAVAWGVLLFITAALVTRRTDA